MACSKGSAILCSRPSWSQKWLPRVLELRPQWSQEERLSSGSSVAFIGKAKTSLEPSPSLTNLCSYIVCQKFYTGGAGEEKACFPQPPPQIGEWRRVCEGGWEACHQARVAVQPNSNQYRFAAGPQLLQGKSLQWKEDCRTVCPWDVFYILQTCQKLKEELDQRLKENSSAESFQKAIIDFRTTKVVQKKRYNHSTLTSLLLYNFYKY